jgi:X-X-X-Leu-X-X-Gly heptad repeat protein
MARKGNTDLVSALRSQGLRKRVARALADLESGGRDARGNAEKLARRVIDDLRSAADTIEKRLDIGGAGTRSAAAKKGASTRKRAATKRSASAKKAASTRARKAPSGASKATSGARKAASGARKAASGARKTTARKRATKRS